MYQIVKNFSGMFAGCSLLSDIKPLEKWNVSNCKNFSGMFGECSLLSDIKSLEKWNKVCSLVVHHYQILNL